MNLEKLKEFLIEPSPEEFEGKNLGDIGVITMSPQTYKKYKLGWLILNVGFTTKSIAAQVATLKKSRAKLKGIMYAPLTEIPVFVHGFDLIIWSHGFIELDSIKSFIFPLESGFEKELSQERIIYTAKPRYIFTHPSWALSQSINIPSNIFAEEIIKVPNLDLGTDYDFNPEFWNPQFLDYSDNYFGVKC